VAPCLKFLQFGSEQGTEGKLSLDLLLLFGLCCFGQIYFRASAIVALVEILPPRRNAMKLGAIRLAGTIQKLIDRSALKEPQQAQIALTGADYLYDALRVPNTHGWEEGRAVEVTIRLL
jgi:hypothetical protein